MKLNVHAERIRNVGYKVTIENCGSLNATFTARKSVDDVELGLAAIEDFVNLGYDVSIGKDEKSKRRLFISGGIETLRLTFDNSKDCARAVPFFQTACDLLYTDYICKWYKAAARRAEQFKVDSVQQIIERLQELRNQQKNH